VQNQAPGGGFAYQSRAGAAPSAPAGGAPVAPPQQYSRAAQGQAGGLVEGTTNAPAEVRLQRAAEAVNQPAQEQRAELAQTADAYGVYRGGSAEGRANAAITNIAPGEPINVEIPAEYADKQLVVLANARGVMVANTNTDRGRKN
jgi:hypothetical protein